MPDPRPAELTVAVRDLQLASHEASQAIARRLELGATDATALQVIFGAGEPIGPVELGHRLGIRSASATALVDRLERSGHVRRVAHPQDGRRVVVEATDRSRIGSWNALRPLLAALDQVAADLTPAEQLVVLHYLRTVTATLNEYAQHHG